MSRPLAFSNRNQVTSELPVDASEAQQESSSKRRKTRKGTRSCWACKKRKERCIFVKEEVTCVSCHKRGTACVSQDLPDEPPSRTENARSPGDLRRVQSLLEQLLDKLDAERYDGHQKANGNGLDHRTEKAEPGHVFEAQAQPVSSNVLHNDTRAISDDRDSTMRAAQSRLKCQGYLPRQSQDISQTLYAALPSQHDAEIICRATRRYQMGDIMICPYDEYESDGQQLSAELLDYPPPTAPPALIAKHLLRFAVHLQQRFRPGLHPEVAELSAALPELIASYADAAAHFLAQDRLQGSVESLECVVLQAIYECSRGSMRLSWMLVRRAIGVAQMNGFHLRETRLHHQRTPDAPAKAPFAPRKMWIRLNYYDRLGSLLLALPAAVEDDSSARSSVLVDETPLSKLERMHCAILGDIVKRNQADLPFPNFEATKALDRELQEVATILPASWWMMPLLKSDRSSINGFCEDTKRLTLQMIHSHLILQVHLPYLLLPSPGSGYPLSRIACVDSAREVLTRFIMCRSLNHDDMVCRVSDFIAFTAAVTLALAYLSRHHQCLANSAWPAHHRHGDLGMITRVEEIMREDHPFGFDPQSAHMADVLRQLLRMEAKAAEGRKVAVEHIKTSFTPMVQDQAKGLVSVQIPYFGTIVVYPEAPTGQEVSGRRTASAHAQQGTMFRPGWTAEHPQSSVNSASIRPVGDLGAPDLSSFSSTAAPPADLQAITQSEDLISNNAAIPGMLAGADDWALQGIDTTLFSSLFGQAGGDWVLNA